MVSSDRVYQAICSLQDHLHHPESAAKSREPKGDLVVVNLRHPREHWAAGLYLLFRDLAALGFFKSRKLWLVSVARLLLLFFGVSVVWNRRHKNGEAFFCTFLVNMVLFIAFLVPIERLVCDCRTGTWAQCNAAQSFKYPEGARYNPYRPMPIDEDQKREELGPDTRMQKAEPPDILYVLRPPRSSSLLQEVASQEPSLRLPKRLLGKKALHQAGKQQSMLMLDAPDEPKESEKSKEPENPTEAENSKPENPTEPENSKPENPTEPENSKPENPTEPVNSKGPGKSEEPAKTKESEDTPRNISKACRDVFPKGIPETLTADDLAALNDLPVLLDLRQSLPEKVTQDLDEAEQQKITELLHELCDEHMGTLGLMPKAENKAETEKQALYMTDLIELNAGEQVKALDQHFRRTCRCEGHSSCNWYSYGAHMTMWCYVAESSVPWCHLEGIQLFKDTKNKTWTVDLCQEGSCKCAGLGMPAEDEDTVDADNPLIQKNPIYYGYKCGKWRNGDTLSWCWAGMDSSCFNRDRPLPPDYKTSNWPKGMLYMFRSVEPCSNNNLGQGPGGRLEPALQLCEYLQVST